MDCASVNKEKTTNQLVSLVRKLVGSLTRISRLRNSLSKWAFCLFDFSCFCFSMENRLERGKAADKNDALCGKFYFVKTAVYIYICIYVYCCMYSCIYLSHLDIYLYNVMLMPFH